jgi:hypothetical protein
MNCTTINLFIIKMIVFLILFISGSAGVSESSDLIIEGELEAYTQRSVKVKGWYYFLCPQKKESENKGLWVYNPNGQEIGYENMSGALRVKVYVKKNKNCVWKIKVLEFAR